MASKPLLYVEDEITLDQFVDAWNSVEPSTVKWTGERTAWLVGTVVDVSVRIGEPGLDEYPAAASLYVQPGRRVRETLLVLRERLESFTGWNVRVDDEDLRLADEADTARSRALSA